MNPVAVVVGVVYLAVVVCILLVDDPVDQLWYAASLAGASIAWALISFTDRRRN